MFNNTSAVAVVDTSQPATTSHIEDTSSSTAGLSAVVSASSAAGSSFVAVARGTAAVTAAPLLG